MVDIARQTVEFLYEENGGIPRDLYLPTIEDIKDEANKFTIDKVRKGMSCTSVWGVSEFCQACLSLHRPLGPAALAAPLPATQPQLHLAGACGLQHPFFLVPGLTVVTRCPDSNNVAPNPVGTALPKFAIRGMLKTFGLHGVVLDVDSAS